MSLGFLLLVTLLANAILAAMSGVLTRYFDAEAVWIGRLIAAVITFLGTFGLFYLIYRLLPERKLSKTALLIGAVASTILFSLGRIGIGFYLGHTDAVTAFGAAGSLAVVLIWVYYSALAFFVGALVARYVEEGDRIEDRGSRIEGATSASAVFRATLVYGVLGAPHPTLVASAGRSLDPRSLDPNPAAQYSTTTGSSDRHRYHVATLRHGRQRVP